MRFMKTWSLAIAVAAAVTVGGLGVASASGVPVVDAAALANNQQNQVANLAKYVEMISQYKTQISQMKSQYDSLTGSRGLGSILNNPQFSSYLPGDWKNVYDQVNSGGYQGLSGSARALVDAAGLMEACQRSTGASKLSCERGIAKTAQDKANAMAAFDAAAARWTQIQGLMERINSTTDPKAIAELQARINAEQAAIQNEQTKLQMFQILAQAEERVMQQQQREISRQEAARRGWTKISPIDPKGN